MRRYQKNTFTSQNLKTKPSDKKRTRFPLRGFILDLSLLFTKFIYLTHAEKVLKILIQIPGMSPHDPGSTSLSGGRLVYWIFSVNSPQNIDSPHNKKEFI